MTARFRAPSGADSGPSRAAKKPVFRGKNQLQGSPAGPGLVRRSIRCRTSRGPEPACSCAFAAGSGSAWRHPVGRATGPAGHASIGVPAAPGGRAPAGKTENILRDSTAAHLSSSSYCPPATHLATSGDSEKSGRGALTATRTDSRKFARKSLKKSRGNEDMANQKRASETLVSMLYSSKATVPFGQTELADLVSSAIERNRRRRVTGALFHADGDFLQWIEGPAESVNRLFDRISRDPRHSNIEVLATGSAESRVFADWNLRLFNDKFSVPETLHLARPCATCKAPNCMSQEVALDLAHGKSKGLKGALRTTRDQLDAQICYCERLMDRFAELWSDDLCSEAEITIGKALALSAIRRSAAANSAMLLPRCRDRILVTSAPGEHHHVRAALATTMLSSAGYPTVYFPPKTIEELAETLFRTRYAGLVLVKGNGRLSAAQQHTLGEICRLARYWSRPRLKVAIYGRVPAPREGRADLAGADQVCSSARHLPNFFDRDVRRIH